LLEFVPRQRFFVLFAAKISPVVRDMACHIHARPFRVSLTPLHILKNNFCVPGTPLVSQKTHLVYSKNPFVFFSKTLFVNPKRLSICGKTLFVFLHALLSAIGLTIIALQDGGGEWAESEEGAAEQRAEAPGGGRGRRR
jgi:hypothetical protein